MHGSSACGGIACEAPRRAVTGCRVRERECDGPLFSPVIGIHYVIYLFTVQENGSIHLVHVEEEVAAVPPE